MNQENIKIKLIKIVSDKLITRKSICLINDKIHQLSEPQRDSSLIVELDFINIKFMSRSFADEIYNLEKKIIKNKMNLVFIHMNKEVKNMFKIVAKHRLEPVVKRSKIKIKAKNLDSLIYQF